MARFCLGLLTQYTENDIYSEELTEVIMLTAKRGALYAVVFLLLGYCLMLLAERRSEFLGFLGCILMIIGICISIIASLESLENWYTSRQQRASS